MLLGIFSTYYRWCLMALVSVCLFTTAMPAVANQIINGNFETGDLTGWVEFHQDPQVASSVVSSPVMDGSYSLLTPTSVAAKASVLCGGVSTPTSQFHYSADIAVMESTADRLVQIIMRTADVTYPNIGGGGQINMYVNPSGDLYLYGTGSGWNKIGSGAFSVTADTGTSGWDGETPSMNTLEVIGDFTDSPYYDVVLNDTNLGTFSYFQSGAPGTGSVPRELHWVYAQGTMSDSGAPGVLWDNISVVNTAAVPEPSTIVMFLTGILGLLAYLRCNRK